VSLQNPHGFLVFNLRSAGFWDVEESRVRVGGGGAVKESSDENFNKSQICRQPASYSSLFSHETRKGERTMVVVENTRELI